MLNKVFNLNIYWRYKINLDCKWSEIYCSNAFTACSSVYSKAYFWLTQTTAWSVSPIIQWLQISQNNWVVQLIERVVSVEPDMRNSYFILELCEQLFLYQENYIASINKVINLILTHKFYNTIYTLENWRFYFYYII